MTTRHVVERALERRHARLADPVGDRRRQPVLVERQAPRGLVEVEPTALDLEAPAPAAAGDERRRIAVDVRRRAPPSAGRARRSTGTRTRWIARAGRRSGAREPTMGPRARRCRAEVAGRFVSAPRRPSWSRVTATRAGSLIGPPAAPRSSGKVSQRAAAAPSTPADTGRSLDAPCPPFGSPRSRDYRPRRCQGKIRGPAPCDRPRVAAVPRRSR